jgi:peptide/nickel transport system permease protein
MLRFLVRRLLIMIPMVLLISVVSFVIIQLPPGDYLASYVARLTASGGQVDQSVLESLKVRYGLGDPGYLQYLKWIRAILLRGDFGESFEYNLPVSWLIGERMMLTIALSALTLILTWVVALPIGIYSAVRQYALGDYIFTFLGFIGMATPSFLLALIVLYFLFHYFGMTISGLFSAEFENAPWSIGKLLDLARHIWIPALILGVGGTASLIRILRANLLDEMHKPYVTTARAYGFKERTVILRFPVRVALNPFVSSVGWSLPYLVSGSIIVAIIFNLQTVGPIFYVALLGQDMYLAGSIVFLLSVLTLVGTLISDLLLAWLDPRIRYH